MPRQTVSAARPVARRRRDLPGGDTLPRLARPAAACPTAVLSLGHGARTAAAHHDRHAGRVDGGVSRFNLPGQPQAELHHVRRDQSHAGLAE